MTWLPDMPKLEPSYQGERTNNDTKLGRIQEPHPSYPTDRDGDAKRPKLTALIPQRNKIFEDFNTKIANTKFRNVIGRVGPPPSAQQDGQEVQMCASYHLLGQCSVSCARMKDHEPHSSKEDQQLYTWCEKAFT
jgi:hypothetical protein